MPYRILCLHAHPDDAEILCAGTLLHLKDRGHEIAVVTMTAGDCGSDVHPPAEISRIRFAEAQTAAESMGAEYACLGFQDLAIFVDDSSRRRVTAALRQFRPDIVLTAPSSDYHCDHEATGILVRDACFGASAPNYDTSAYSPAPALPAIPHLYFVDPVDGVDRDGNAPRPHFMVDISATLARKAAALGCHESQRAWLKRQHGIDDYIDQMHTWSRSRGALAGFSYGEGFRQYTGHPWPTSPLLQELLGELARPL